MNLAVVLLLLVIALLSALGVAALQAHYYLPFFPRQQVILVAAGATFGAWLVVLRKVWAINSKPSVHESTSRAVRAWRVGLKLIKLSFAASIFVGSPAYAALQVIFYAGQFVPGLTMEMISDVRAVSRRGGPRLRRRSAVTVADTQSAREISYYSWYEPAYLNCDYARISVNSNVFGDYLIGEPSAWCIPSD